MANKSNIASAQRQKTPAEDISSCLTTRDRSALRKVMALAAEGYSAEVCASASRRAIASSLRSISRCASRSCSIGMMMFAT